MLLGFVAVLGRECCKDYLYSHGQLVEFIGLQLRKVIRVDRIISFVSVSKILPYRARNDSTGGLAVSESIMRTLINLMRMHY